MQSSAIQYGFIFLYYAFLIIPYFFLGLTITILLTRFSDIIHRLYFWNLLGSALGCVAFLVLLVAIGGEESVLAVSALMMLGAAFLFASRKMKAVSVGFALFFVLLIPVADTILPVHPAPSKALGMFMEHTPDLKIESSEWDPIARIDVVSSPAFGKRYRYNEAEVQKIFTIDGDAFTFVYRFDRPLHEVDLIGKTLYGSAYFFKDKPKVAVIGLGGGMDIATALHFQSREITGVEINQAMIDAANAAFDTYPIHPYKDPRVTIIHEEGRSFLRKVNEKYDIIQMSGVDTWSALASGAYVLSENYLYTKEAFGEYYDHLVRGGMLCMMRWIFDPPRECLRLVTIQSEILRERGLTQPRQHFVILKQGLLASVVTKMLPFTRGEIQQLRETLEDKPELEILYAPGIHGNSVFHNYFEARKNGAEESFMRRYPFKLSTVSDDKPFFFEFYKWRDMFRPADPSEGGYLVASRPVGYIILVVSLIQAFLFGCIFILVPLYHFKKSGLVTEGSGGMIAYFSALGLGFMFLEVSLMQKFVLFLGHPTYSITVTLFTLLVFSGIGSFIAGRISMEPRRLILTATFAVGLIAALYAILLTSLFNALLGLPLFARMGMAVVVLAPLGIFMGMPFPTGLAYVRRRAQSFVPWAFGINGVASVIASILCIIIALMAGFRVVMIVAALIYITGGLILSRLSFENPGGKQ